MADLKITYIKSVIGRNEKQRKTLQALGLRKLNQTVVKKNNEATLGMVNVVSHLIKVEEV